MNNTAVFVLGMHRSGTSLISGLLRILGVDFGPDSDLMRPSQFNPKGFFEHVALNGLNSDVMIKFGGEWYAPPALIPGWENSEPLSDLRRRAAERIQETFGRSAVWGFKDPRTCITVPFWRRVVQGPIKVIVVGRNPIDASRSLQQVQRILASEACELWSKYMVAAFLGSRGLPRHVVFYEDFMSNLRREMELMGSFVQKPVTPAVMAEAERFTERSFRHYESTTDDVVGGYGITPKARKVYLTMRSFVDVARAGKYEPEDDSTIERVLAEIQVGG